MNLQDKSEIINYVNQYFTKELDNKAKECLKKLVYKDTNSVKIEIKNCNLTSDEATDVKSCLDLIEKTDEFRKLYHNTFSSTTYPLNFYNLIDKPIMITPDLNNKRIRAQDGYFILESYVSNLFNNPKNISRDIKGNIFSKISIPREYKSDLLKELDNVFKINKAKLFPDYSDVAEYLNKHIDQLPY